jgi:hypothetical protein
VSIWPLTPLVRQRFDRWLLGSAVVAVWAVGLANCWFALRDPLELEVREGTVWLHVLAQTDGVSLYDHSRVAFLNMNHGPVDPLFKAWLHRVAPILPAQVVTRAFVALLPLALAVLFWRACGRGLAAALWGGGLYLFLLGLGSAQFLIGRSDPTALVFLCALLGVGEWLRRREVTPIKAAIGGVAMGTLAIIAALINWRYAPAALGILGVAGLDVFARATEGSRLRVTLAFASAAVFAAMLGWGSVFMVLFQGNGPLYYRHFFGVFTRASGWGTQGRMPLELLPIELREGRSLLHAAIAVMVIVMLKTATPSVRRSAITWLIVIAGLWLAVDWGYGLNHGAGGLHYFAPCYVMIAFMLATRLDWKKWPRTAAIALVVVCFAGLPWPGAVGQARQLATIATEARNFLTELRSRTAGTNVYSEDVHLFETAYSGQVVDVGDMVTRVAASGYMGEEFRTLVDHQAQTLRRAPPEFVVMASNSVISPTLRDLLSKYYRAELQSAPLVLAQDGLPLTLYRRQAAGPLSARRD